MKVKIGRNDPCFCGSGKKYKRCCFGAGKEMPNPKFDGADRLTIMRTAEKMKKNNKMIDIVGRLTKSPITGSFRGFLESLWTFEKVDKMTTEEITAKLASMNIRFVKEDFERATRIYSSAADLAEDLYYTQDYILADRMDEDFIWMAATILWKRLAPDRHNAEMVDDLMQDGYDLIERSEYELGIARWDDAWNIIKEMIPSHIMSVEGADEFLSQLTQSIYNWCQDFEMELENAASHEGKPVYHERRKRYCQEFCARFPDSEELIMCNMLRAEAESYFYLGDVMTADSLFRSLAERFPSDPWVYVWWGDIYSDLNHNYKNPQNSGEAERIYRLGLEMGRGEDLKVLEERIFELQSARARNDYR